MSRKKLSQRERDRIIDWVKRIYTEIEDSEAPELLEDEFYATGYDHGYSDACRDLKKKLLKGLSGLQRSIRAELNKEIERVTK
jgi:hypothetical protein